NPALSRPRYLQFCLLSTGLAVPRSSPPCPSPSPPQITFYEGKCFTGRRLDVCGTCCSFQDRGFLNRVNSICVRSGAWVCFAHPNLRGQQYVLEHGEWGRPDGTVRRFHLGCCGMLKVEAQ
uniref:Beta/gamma crystallin 'Greek key' domain-containing protein n=1 Tax=Anas zonorhyncha TaxID=75864 RepID=A0A8B9UQC9_9AVES